MVEYLLLELEVSPVLMDLSTDSLTQVALDCGV